jgi:hypothetical protein
MVSKQLNFKVKTHKNTLKTRYYTNKLYAFYNFLFYYIYTKGRFTPSKGEMNFLIIEKYFKKFFINKNYFLKSTY